MLKEDLPNVSPEWLGGFLSVGGSMHFETRVKKSLIATYVYVYPFVKYGDSDFDRMQRLTRLLGGKFKPERGRSFQWWTMGQKAADLAQICKNFAPSRTNVIAAFELWENSDIEERLTLVEDSATDSLTTPTTKGDYLSLVRSPGFLAGALDSRAVFFIHENYEPDKGWGWNTLRMHLTTQNVGLVKALQQNYGGNFSTEVSEGDVRDFGDGVSAVAQKDSVRWNVGSQLCAELIAFTDQYRKLQKPR